MLKKFTWIAAALLAMFAMVFLGCFEPGVDDGSAPVVAEDFVIEGDDIILKACGQSSSNVTIDGNKATLKGNNTGFYFDFPAEAADYTEVQVFFKIAEIIEGKPGLLIKRSTKFDNPVGITSNEDPAYQLNDAATSGKDGFPIKPGFGFTVGMEFDTGKWKISQFDDQMAFQNQVYNPEGNSNAHWTVEVLKIVFPGVADAAVTFEVEGGKAVASIIVQQGKEIGDLPVTTKDNAVFTGWYTTTASTITAEGVQVVRPIGTEVLSDFIVPFEKTLTLKAGWATTGVTTTKNSIIHAYPAFTSPSPANTITVGANGSASFAKDDNGWPAVKYEYPTAVKTANGTGTPSDPYTYKYNVVELTVDASEDFAIQVKDQNAGGDINKYPTGDQVVSLKKGLNTFSVALSDSGLNGLSIQNKSNDDGNKAKTGPVTVTIVSAVFTEGTMYKVSFDNSVSMKFTDVATQTIISGRKATRPNTSSSGWIINSGVNVYDFLGWYLDGKLYDFSAAVTADIDLVSKWTVVNNRKVTFDLTGLTIDDDPFNKVQVINTIAADPDASPAVLAANPLTSGIVLPTITAGTEPEDTTFGGWFDVSVTPFVKYYDGATSTWAITSMTKDITLKALFATTFEVALGTDTTPNVVPDTNNHAATFATHPDATYAAATGLSVDFSTGTAGSNSRKTIFIPLTTAQHTSMKSAISVTLTITTTGGTTGQYRYGFGDNTLGADWNGTVLTGWAVFANGANTASPNFMPYAKNGDATTLKNILIQSNGATTDTLVITKIEVSVVQ